MTGSTRRKVGLSLIAISGLVFIGTLTADFIRGQARLDGDGGGSAGAGALWSDRSYAMDFQISDTCFILIILCGLTGLICLAWPTRKPPKLKK